MLPCEGLRSHLERRWQHDDGGVDVLQARQQAAKTGPGVGVVGAGLDQVCAQQGQRGRQVCPCSAYPACVQTVALSRVWLGGGAQMDRMLSPPPLHPQSCEVTSVDREYSQCWLGVTANQLGRCRPILPSYQVCWSPTLLRTVLPCRSSSVAGVSMSGCKL